MALRWYEAFFGAAGDLRARYQVSGSPAISTDYGRGGRPGVLISGTNQGITWIGDNQPTWITGMAVRGIALGAFGVPSPFVLYDGGTVQMRVRLNTDGTLSVMRGTTVLATSTYALPSTAHVYLEFRVTIHNTAGAYELRAGEQTILSATNVNTRNSTNNFANAIAIGVTSTSTISIQVADWYICDGTGTEQNDFLGDKKMLFLPFPEVGNYDEWGVVGAGTTVQAVTKDAISDAAYIEGDVGQRVSFVMPALPAGVGALHGVMPIWAMRKDDAGTVTVKPFTRVAGVDTDGMAVSLADAYLYYWQIYGKHPSGADWTKELYEAMEAGWVRDA